MIFYLLPPLLLAAVFSDLKNRKIPNALIVGGMITGSAYQWSANGPPGMADFCSGALMPLVLLGVLHYFRMLGAGDLKLLIMAGGFLGIAGSMACIVLSFLIAGVIAAGKLLRHRILGRRLRYFAEYLRNYHNSGKWVPYITGKEKEEGIHFSVAVLLAVMILLIYKNRSGG